MRTPVCQSHTLSKGTVAESSVEETLLPVNMPVSSLSLHGGSSLALKSLGGEVLYLSNAVMMRVIVSSCLRLSSRCAMQKCVCLFNFYNPNSLEYCETIHKQGSTQPYQPSMRDASYTSPG